jgi:hypothetical protein
VRSVVEGLARLYEAHRETGKVLRILDTSIQFARDYQQTIR